jgi:hypothetical protein
MSMMLHVHENDIHREVSAIYGDEVATWVVAETKKTCRVGGSDFLFCRYDYLGDAKAWDLFPNAYDPDSGDFEKLETHNREWAKANPESAKWWRLGFSDEFTAVGFDRESWEEGII